MMYKMSITINNFIKQVTKFKNMKTKILISTIIIFTLFLSACSKSLTKTEESDKHTEEENEGVLLLNKVKRDALNLKLGLIQEKNLTTRIKTNGQLMVSPKSKADITAFIGGNVKEISVFHGDKVSKGQTLAILEHPDYITLQEDFIEVSSRKSYLGQEYDRQKTLFENNVGAGKDFQQIKAEFNTINSKYNGLKARLNMLNLNYKEIENGHIFNQIEIKSPLSGYVNEINIKVGSYIDSDTKMFSVSDNSDIHADFLVYEKDIHKLKVGQKIDFTMANDSSEDLTATIFAIAKEFQKDVRAVLVHAQLNEPTDKLISGLYVSGYVNTDKTKVKALPESAVVTEGTKSFIFILDENVTESESHDDHGHETTFAKSNEPDNHDHSLEENKDEHENETWAFRMVEIVTGVREAGFVEIKTLEKIPTNTQVVLNTAYYLLADLKKSEAKHEH